MKLHTELLGTGTDKPPLVILHGLFGAGDNWRTQATELSQERLVVLPDLPNHGKSPHTEAAGIVDMAETVVANMQDLGIGAADWLGHSLGGKIAMVVALTQPDSVQRLVVADIAPKPYPPRHAMVFEAMRAVEEAEPAVRSEADRIMAAIIPNKPIRLFLLKSLVRLEDGSYKWRLNVDALERHYADLSGWPLAQGASTSTFEGATLFVRGELSDYVEDGDLDLIKQFFPTAELNTIANTGHWLHAEQKDVFLEMVRRFLA